MKPSRFFYFNLAFMLLNAVLFLVSISYIGFALYAFALSTESKLDNTALKERFAPLGLNVLSVQHSDINGLVELETNNGVFYASPKGEYFIAGTLYHLDDKGGYTDVQAIRAAPKNAAKVAAMKEHMLEYTAPNERYEVTVFTDISCGYCVQLHSQMAQYHEAGISVRYLAFPRQGASSPTAKTMASVWCSENQHQAFDQAMQNKAVNQPSFAKCESSITEQYELGRQLNISGTPAIVLKDGEIISGYLPPNALLQRLEQKEAMK